MKQRQSCASAELLWALERFAAKCEFDARTGCVLWTGGTTTAQAATAKYGAFWFEGRRWCAHRWAAQFIHGLAIDGMEVDHCCPASPLNPRPNTLCVQHLQAVTQLENLQLKWGRIYWGWDEPPLPFEDEPDEQAISDLVPFYDEPRWLRAFRAPEPLDVCPF